MTDHFASLEDNSGHNCELTVIFESILHRHNLSLSKSIQNHLPKEYLFALCINNDLFILGISFDNSGCGW